MLWTGFAKKVINLSSFICALVLGGSNADQKLSNMVGLRVVNVIVMDWVCKKIC